MTNEQIIEIVENTVKNLDDESTVDVDYSEIRKKNQNNQTIFGFHIDMWGKMSANFFIHSKFFDITCETFEDEDYKIECNGLRTQTDFTTMMFVANQIIDAIKIEMQE